MIKFLHTSDWQLGMSREYLSDEAQARYAQARFDAIRKMGRMAREHECAFMLVCGDVFESNQVSPQTLSKCFEALREVELPVYILPANHDPLNADSPWLKSRFKTSGLTHVHILKDFKPVTVAHGVELFGAPWHSKRPAVNPFVELLNNLPPKAGTKRICAAHGNLDIYTRGHEDQHTLTLAMLQSAIAEKKFDYIALGDRHSQTRVGDKEGIWYCGTPVATDFDETLSGTCAVVTLDSDGPFVQDHKPGEWRFLRKQADLNTASDVQALKTDLEALTGKEVTVLELTLKGSLPLLLHAEVLAVINTVRDVFAGLKVKDHDLMCVPSDADFTDLGFSGFADSAVKKLRAKMSGAGPEAETAREAFKLLLRLARSDA